MAGEVGRVLLAFSRKHVYDDSGTVRHKAEVQFDLYTITMGGILNNPNEIWAQPTFEDITGDSSTNPNMFTSGTTPNAAVTNGTRALTYNFDDLPDNGTERTYRLNFPSAPVIGNSFSKEITVWVHGKHHFYTRVEGTAMNNDTKEKSLIRVPNPPIVNTASNPFGGPQLNHAWAFYHNKFQHIDVELSTTDYRNASCTGIGTSHSGTTNNIPDATFYIKELADQKSTFTDFKFRPDKDADYANYSHTTNWNNCGGLPKISLDSYTMNNEMINEGASVVGTESQYLSWIQSPHGEVPTTKLSILIVQENVGGQASHSSLSESSNADYAAMLTTLNGSSVDIRGYAYHGYGVTIWNTFGSSPCDNYNIGYALINQQHESQFGANDGELEVSGTNGQAPYTYEWTGPNNFIANTAAISSLVPGTYVLKITDSYGCTQGVTFVINAGPPPCQGTVTISQIAGDGCGMIDLNPTVSNLASGITTYTWEWKDGFGSVVSSGNNSQGATLAVNSVTSPGLYIFEVDLGNGCVKSGQTAVVASTSLAVTMSSTDVTTNGGSDGTASVAVSGGTAPYTYLWSNGNTSSSLSGLTAGTYSVYITDVDGCYVTGSVTITEPAILPPGVSPLDVCMNLSTNKFTFTDNNNYLGTNNTLPYKIAIKVKLVNNNSVIYTGALSSPDIFIDNDLASLRTYNATTKYGTNTDITILSGGTLYNDVYEITFDWNFSGGTTVEATETILLNGLSITTFNALAISSSITYNCNDDIINSLDMTNYSINNVPYSFTRTHSLSPPSGSSLSSPVLSSSASALNYTGLEVGAWSNSIITDIIWDMPGTVSHEEYCIIKNLTYTNNKNVLCYVDPCVVTECIEKVRAKLDRAECNCDENDIKKYRHILKRTGHLLAMYDITLDCTSIIDDPTLLYDIIDLTDCGCDCECGGCD